MTEFRIKHGRTELPATGAYGTSLQCPGSLGGARLRTPQIIFENTSKGAHHTHRFNLQLAVVVVLT